MSHASAGVEKGRQSSNRLPVEVMGLLVGHIDTSSGEAGSLVVTDAFPLPVEGTETSVMSDDPAVLAHMVRLSDALEATRPAAHFCGWYHSHPFDVGAASNAFLSATDVSTQLAWQLTEDRAGNPWLAIVVDPLRGAAKGRPEMGAFRCYPPAHVPPRGLAPDGVVWTDERARNARWGESCVAYYQLSVEYFMSTAAAGVMGALARDFMWTRVLSTTGGVLDADARDRLPERVRRIADKVDAAEAAANAVAAAAGLSRMGGFGAGATGGAGGGGGGAGFGGGGGGIGAKAVDTADAALTAGELAVEVLRGQATLAMKLAAFEGVPVGATAGGALSFVAAALDVPVGGGGGGGGGGEGGGGGAAPAGGGAGPAGM
jgi:COP9 signalosome complex subunit 5